MDILEKIKIKRDVQLEEELKSFKQPSLKEVLKQDGVRIIGEIKGLLHRREKLRMMILIC